MTTRRGFLQILGIGVATTALPATVNKALSAPVSKPKTPTLTIKGCSLDTLSEIDIRQMEGRSGMPLDVNPCKEIGGGPCGGYYYTLDWATTIPSWKYHDVLFINKTRLCKCEKI